MGQGVIRDVLLATRDDKGRVTITGQLARAGETLTLEGYIITYIPA